MAERDVEDRIRRLFVGVTSGYDTHRPVLCEAVLRSDGPILELGMGDGSTPPLHGVAVACSRSLFSFENDTDWIARYSHLRCEQHHLSLSDSWDECPVESQFWSLAFIDHAPAKRRAIELARLSRHAEIIVVHDTEDLAYGYGTALDTFDSRFDYRRYKQWTTVLSNYVDLREWAVQDDR